ncbi:MAG: PAS domain S-box protein [Candidatus Krumholzibacteriota bacterium]|nr:PAS domain S-box protein [Candidatus Krumholzibacteriota bacterium]
MSNPEIRRRRRPSAAPLLAAALAASILAAGLLSVPARAGGEEARRRHILLLLSYNRSVEWEYRAERGFRAHFRSRVPLPVTIDTEFLDLSRYDGTPYRETLVHLIEAKYPPGSLDVVVCMETEAVTFVMRYGERLFPGVAYVFAAEEQRFIYKAMGDFDMTGVFRNEDFAGTMKIALDLFPGTRRVYLVSGTNASEYMLRNKARREFALSGDCPEIVSWDDRSLARILDEVASLPANSIVFYLGLQRDADGVGHNPREALQSIAARANAPVFGLYDTDLLGHQGILGGSTVCALDQGHAAAALAARILNGEEPDSIDVERLERSVNFNWNQLQRWGIDKKRLPPGSRIRNVMPTFFRIHRKKVVVTAILVIVQAMFIVLLVINNTHRRRMQKALSESERNYREIFNGANDAILIHDDATLSIVDVNERAAVLFGFSRNEMIGKSLGLLFPGESPRSEDEAEKRLSLAREKTPQIFEWRARRKDGGRFWVEVTARRAVIGGRNRILAVARDIAERTRAKEALRESEERMSVVFDASEAGIALVDAEGRIDFANHRMARMLGHRSRGEIIGVDFRSYLHPSSLEANERTTGQLRDGSLDHLLFERRFVRANGEEFWGHASVRALPGTDKSFRGMVVVVTDITERKHMEEMTARLEEQVRQAQKMEAVGTLAGGIAHDFNNILTPILGFAEMALEETEQGSLAHGDIGEVIKAGQRARALVRQILTFSRQSDADRIPVRIQSVVPDALALIRASIPPSIELVSGIDPDVGPILADPTQIQQIVMNLCINAYHAMAGSGGVLHVELEETKIASKDPAVEESLVPGPYAKLIVRDTGKGMSQAVAERVFEPYFTTKHQGEGTGLGLSVVHGIVKSCAGAISLSSEPGAGTTVTVLLPVIEPQGPEANEDEMSALPLPSGTERIMIVDDEETIIEMERKMLEGLGYRVAGFLDSEEAREAFLADPGAIDLVLTDLAMPRLTGIELAEEMLAARGDIPIILCTGYGEMVDEKRLLRVGIRELYPKPVRRRELAERIRRVLDTDRSRHRPG